MKIEKDLKRQIREIEKKAKDELIASGEIQPAPEAQDDCVSFDQWWMTAHGKHKMRPHIKEILWAEFKSRGLSKKEKQEAYDKALKVFGV